MFRILFLLTSLVLSGSAAFAGGHTSTVADEEQRTAETHANDKPVPTPAATQVPARPISSRAANYTSIDGEPVTGWLAWPAGEPTADLPGLIVIHEWWGLNDNIRRTAERLAGEGYVTLAVDLYRGESGASPKDAMRLMQTLNAAGDNGRENLAGAYDYLTTVSGASKIGAIGWCLGGRWSLQAALRLPDELDAAVIYYGNVIDDKAQLETLQMPILGLFAGIDPIVPQKSVIAFRDTMKELGKDVDIHIYPDVKHAFSNPSGLAYNAEAADDAWQKATAFLEANLK
jgi:carboxymethylenebutenolidase